MLIPFTGQAYKAKYTSLNGQRCVNWYPVLDEANGKSQVALYPTPGHSIFTEITGSQVRGSHEKDGIGYVVVDNTLYTINSSGEKTLVGTLLTSAGRVKFIDNPTQLMLIDGMYGYYYTIATSTLAKIPDTDFPSNPISLDYQDGFGFVVAKHGDGNYRLYYSGANDFSSWVASDLVTPTYKADQVRAVVSVKEQLHLIGDKTLEIFINNNGTIERRPLASLNYGIAATDSAIECDESIIFLAKSKKGQGFVVRYQDGQIKPISTKAIKFAMSKYAKIDDAFAYTIEYQDCLWYVLTFPTENKTWVYDLTSQSWFEWASLSSAVNASSEPGRHTSNCYMFLDGKHIIGDYESGNLYEIKDTPWTDSAGTTATLMLQVSKDGGHNWSPERLREKEIGEYQKRPLWLGLGTARKWMFRLKFADTINTDNGRTVIRIRETSHFAAEDKYISIASLRVEVDIDPVPFCIINAFANGSASGLSEDGDK